MHEVGLMEEALALALEHLRQQGGRRIHGMTFRVGPLSGVEPDALRFAFAVVTRGTCADGATLEVQRAPATCRCAACEQEFEPADFVFACPVCGRLADVRTGREFELLSLEVS
jgi:hydrogenase nickel incorporation protein HypA/HybF